MAATQVHIIDPCGGGLVLVACEDGSRVLFGSSAHLVSQHDVLQRLFEVLEDGAIDYYAHSGVETDNKLDLAAIDEFFPIKTCVEFVGSGVNYPPSYVAFRADRPVEMLEADDVLGFGATNVRLFGAAKPRPMDTGEWRPLALHVAHEEPTGSKAVLALGATGGLDWIAIAKAVGDDLKADCVVVDGNRPLDIVITTGERVDVSIDHLRRIGPSMIVMGAESHSKSPLRKTAMDLYSCFTRENGGQSVIDMKKDGWLTLKLDGDGVRTEVEPRSIGQAA
ncbi:hypothetical protein ABEG18_04075 [Alsobacter sp. KACC 23698]|uniref:Uncharacterized protein n=1 Tax=Alsobacter sp. KACC 23698 TaxID=3149229 RepID=A0AAU7JIE5_9HYPH